MRKLLLSLACLFFMAGLVLATEVTLVKFDKDKKEVTVKEGGAEKTYTITDKTKFSTNDVDGNPKEITYADALKGLANATSPGRLKFEITVKGKEITEAKMRGRRKKN